MKRSVLLKSVRVVLLDYGENVQREKASEREGQLVERRQAGQQQWRHKGVTKRKQRIVVGVVLVVIGRGVTAGEDGEPSEVLLLNFAPHRTLGVASVTPVVLVPFASPCLSGARGTTLTSRPADALGSAATTRGSDGAEALAAQAALRGERRWVETEQSGGAAGQLLTEIPLGLRQLSRLERRERPGAALGKGERERDRGRRNAASRPCSTDEIGATSLEGDSKRDCNP